MSWSSGCSTPSHPFGWRRSGPGKIRVQRGAERHPQDASAASVLDCDLVWLKAGAPGMVVPWIAGRCAGSWARSPGRPGSGSSGLPENCGTRSYPSSVRGTCRWRTSASSSGTFPPASPKRCTGTKSGLRLHRVRQPWTRSLRRLRNPRRRGGSRRGSRRSKEVPDRSPGPL